MSFSIVPRAEANVINCREDITSFELLKNCPFYRVCGPQDKCICYRKEEATPKINENTPSKLRVVLINKTQKKIRKKIIIYQCYGSDSVKCNVHNIYNFQDLNYHNFHNK